MGSRTSGQYLCAQFKKRAVPHRSRKYTTAVCRNRMSILAGAVKPSSVLRAIFAHFYASGAAMYSAWLYKTAIQVYKYKRRLAPPPPGKKQQNRI